MLKFLTFVSALTTIFLSVNARKHCPYGNGLYCGDVLGREKDVLYRCSGKSSFKLIEKCQYGCYQDKPGSPDYCKPSGDQAVSGDSQNNPKCSNGTNPDNSNNSTDSYTSTLGVENYPLVFEFRNGQCTDWADARYAQITGHHISWSGDARLWSSRAKADSKWTEADKPKVPSIIVLQPGSQGAGGPGHVAVVERINTDGSVYTSNYNFRFGGKGGVGVKSYGDFETGKGVSFIWYGK
ncbi:hypothetical protein K7432_013160 [Basidiobolus ranarum]|uniref:Peptidase C51 domain-containing protein n=1 Tax=Basidiobolus ranarum TaxID=34480 RepID=A0ABR2WJQ6_9FUNG